MSLSIQELDLEDYIFSLMGLYNEDNGAIYDIFHVRSRNKSTNEITDFGVYGSKVNLVF
jgi:hypothetical protein